MVYFFFIWCIFCCLDAHLFNDINGDDGHGISDDGGGGGEDEREKHDLSSDDIESNINKCIYNSKWSPVGVLHPCVICISSKILSYITFSIFQYYLI